MKRREDKVEIILHHLTRHYLTRISIILHYRMHTTVAI